MSRKRGNWSGGELGRLKTLYPTCSEERVASLMNRSVESVRIRAKHVFHRPVVRGDWSGDEDLQLRVSYGVLDIKRLALVLARSERDIRERVRFLRKQRRRGAWTSAEIAMLKRLYGSRTDEDLEVCLSRGRRQIAKQAAELCLCKDKRAGAGNGQAKVRMPRWSLDEEELLAEIYPDHDNLEIARRLGRTVASVASKANLLGLKKSPSALREMGRRNVSIRYSQD